MLYLILFCNDSHTLILGCQPALAGWLFTELDTTEFIFIMLYNIISLICMDWHHVCPAVMIPFIFSFVVLCKEEDWSIAKGVCRTVTEINICCQIKVWTLKFVYLLVGWLFAELNTSDFIFIMFILYYFTFMHKVTSFVCCSAESIYIPLVVLCKSEDWSMTKVCVIQKHKSNFTDKLKCVYDPQSHIIVKLHYTPTP